MTTVSSNSAPLCVNACGSLTCRADRCCETVVALPREIAAMPWFRFLKGMPVEAGRRRTGSVTPARLVPLLLALASGPALAQGADSPPRTAEPSTVCVQVEVAGSRAGNLECAAVTLEQAARTAQERVRAAFETPVIGVQSPDIAKGVANQTALHQRLGSNFGRSVHPQRPNQPAPPTSPSGPR